MHIIGGADVALSLMQREQLIRSTSRNFAIISSIKFQLFYGKIKTASTRRFFLLYLSVELLVLWERKPIP